jgi:hypothetical protein
MSVIILVYFSHAAYFLFLFVYIAPGIISYRRVYHVHTVVDYYIL